MVDVLERSFGRGEPDAGKRWEEGEVVVGTSVDGSRGRLFYNNNLGLISVWYDDGIPRDDDLVLGWLWSLTGGVAPSPSFDMWTVPPPLRPQTSCRGSAMGTCQASVFLGRCSAASSEWLAPRCHIRPRHLKYAQIRSL